MIIELRLTLFSDPAEGEYRAQHTVPWGERLALPEPLEAVIDGSRLPSVEGAPGARS